MTAPVISDAVQREAAYRQIEQLVQEAAEAERAAFVAWQEAYGAYEVARDEAATAWTAWVAAHHPLDPAPGRSGLETKAGRAPRSTHQFRTTGAVMTIRRGEHALKYPHRRLIDATAPDASDPRCCGGEC